MRKMRVPNYEITVLRENKWTVMRTNQVGLVAAAACERWWWWVRRSVHLGPRV